MTTLVGQYLSLLKNPTLGGYSFIYGKHSNLKNAVLQTGAKLREDLLTAKRYHLSSQTAKAAAMYAYNMNDPVNGLLVFARTPFEKIWIEWPLPAQHEGVGLEAAFDAPEFAGNIIQQDKSNPNRYWITSVVGTGDKEPPEVLISPVSVVYDCQDPIGDDEFTEDEEFLISCLNERPLVIVAHRETDDGVERQITDKKVIDRTYARQVLLATLLGGAEGADVSNKLFDLTKHAKWALTPYYGNRFKKIMDLYKDHAKQYTFLKSLVAERLTESSGMYRFAVSALALMQQKKYTKSVPVKPNTRRPDEVDTSKSKVHSSPNFEFVEFTVPHTVFIRDVQGNDFEARERCRHEVSGHFCESHKVGDPNCQHVFTAQSSTREICLLCGSKRWWRKAHERGNADLGYKQRASRLLVSAQNR